MIRAVAYLSIFIGVMLAIANLTLTNSLASEGSRLTSVSGELSTTQAALDRLRQEIMDAQSIATISVRSQTLGLLEPIQQKKLVTTPTISSQQRAGNPR